MTAPAFPHAEDAARRVLAREDYERFLPFVRRIAMRFARKVPRHISVSDLVGYGWVGLVEAFRRADPKMPQDEFEAYALYRVRGAMLDHLRSLDPVSRELRSASRKVTVAIRNLTHALGRAPEEEEIAASLELSLEAYQQLLERVSAAGLARLELLDVEDADVAAEAEPVDEEVARRQLGEAVAGAIDRLPERLRTMLALYYQEGCTLREIGAILGVSESRVSQLHSEAMHRLRALVGRI